MQYLLEFPCLYIFFNLILRYLFTSFFLCMACEVPPSGPWFKHRLKMGNFFLTHDYQRTVAVSPIIYNNQLIRKPGIYQFILSLCWFSPTLLWENIRDKNSEKTVSEWNEKSPEFVIWLYIFQRIVKDQN